MDTTIILVALIVGLGGFTQGLTGFGSVLVAVPLLSMVIDPKLALPVAGVFGWIVNWPIVWKMRHSIQYRTGVILVLSAIPATFIGAKLLANLPSFYISMTIGILLLLSSLQSLRSSTPLFKKTTVPVTLVAGFSSGMLGALGGPPVIAYASMQPWSADQSKSTLAFFFMLQMMGTLASFYYEGLLTIKVFSLVGSAMPIFIIGVIGGMGAYYVLQKYKINYHRIVYCSLFLMGLMLILKDVNF